jgi:hypothetical protein
MVMFIGNYTTMDDGGDKAASGDVVGLGFVRLVGRLLLCSYDCDDGW